MTAQQLQHLAELAGDAARYYRRTRPAWARTMAVAAHIARLAAAHEQQTEKVVRISAALKDIKAEIR
jgi:uncharacterized membrane protein